MNKHSNSFQPDTGWKITDTDPGSEMHERTRALSSEPWAATAVVYIEGGAVTEVSVHVDEVVLGDFVEQGQLTTDGARELAAALNLAADDAEAKAASLSEVLA